MTNPQSMSDERLLNTYNTKKHIAINCHFRYTTDQAYRYWCKKSNVQFDKEGYANFAKSFEPQKKEYLEKLDSLELEINNRKLDYKPFVEYSTY